jgi:hypothetical protein
MIYPCLVGYPVTGMRFSFGFRHASAARRLPLAPCTPAIPNEPNPKIGHSEAGGRATALRIRATPRNSRCALRPLAWESSTGVRPDRPRPGPGPRRSPAPPGRQSGDWRSRVHPERRQSSEKERKGAKRSEKERNERNGVRRISCHSPENSPECALDCRVAAVDNSECGITQCLTTNNSVV